MRLILQEWMLLRRNATLWGLICILLLLMAAATINGVVRAQKIASTTEQLNVEEESTKAALKGAVSRWEQDPVGDPPAVTSPGSVGISILAHYSSLPFRELAPLAIGQSDVEPLYYRVDGRSAYTFMEKAETQNPLNVLSGSFDVAFVVVFLLPVFIIAMTFDLLSKEKERGLLALILAHGVPLRQIVLAKSLSIALIVFIALLGAGLLALWLADADLFSVTTLFDFLSWSVIVILYGFFWFALALLVNSFNLPSVTNGVILSNLWLVFVIVIPAFVNVAATTIFPAPSRVELTTEMREASSKAEEDAAQAREAFFFDHPEMTDAGEASEAFFIQVLSTDAAVEKAVQHLVDEFDAQALKRQETVSLLQYLSPAILTAEALSVVSGTDTRRFNAFAAQTRTFHEKWRTFFADRITRGERLRAEDFDLIPVYMHRDQTIGDRIVRLGGLLAGLVVAFVMIVIWSIHRYRFYPAVGRR